MGDRPGVPLSSGFRTLTDAEHAEVEFDADTRARLLAFMDEADDCRARAAVDARLARVQ